jgi:anti-sigma regulatory factor (Ser/Thr protein kinase)
MEMLDGSGLPLGLRREPRAEAELPRATLLDDDALLVLYTDGVTESGRDVVAGEGILLRAIDAAADAERPAAAIRDAVLRASGIVAVADDIAILTVRLLPNVARRRRFTCDVADPSSASALRKAVVAHMHAEGFTEPALFAAELVTGELLGNVARHAPPIAEVALAFSEGAPVLCMSDRGPTGAFAPRAVAGEAEAGRGLYLVSQLVEELAIVPRAGGGCIVRVVLSREANLAAAGESE